MPIVLICMISTTVLVIQKVANRLRENKESDEEQQEPQEQYENTDVRMKQEPSNPRANNRDIMNDMDCPRRENTSHHPNNMVNFPSSSTTGGSAAAAKNRNDDIMDAETRRFLDSLPVGGTAYASSTVGTSMLPRSCLPRVSGSTSAHGMASESSNVDKDDEHIPVMDSEVSSLLNNVLNEEFFGGSQ